MSQTFRPTIAQLHASDAVQGDLHAAAAEATRNRFGKKVYVRGVVEVSNFCRENCHYCGMRRDNRKLARHRADPAQLAELLVNHRPASITDINIQAGEDPVAVREVVLPLIKILRRETPLGISVSLGSLSPALSAELKAAGASIYIIKFEIGDPAKYAEFEAPGTFDKRVKTIQHLAGTGWNVSSGFIVGLPGQTDADLLLNFEVARSLPIVGCSVSPFIPGDETPLANGKTASLDVTLNFMAALRLMRPDWVIPAVSALNLAGPDCGYRRGLRTGANLVTMNLTPADMRADYVIYKRDRFIMTEERILSAIAAEGLEASTQSLSDYYISQTANGTVQTEFASKS